MSKNLNFELLIPLNTSFIIYASIKRYITKAAYNIVETEEKVRIMPQEQNMLYMVPDDGSSTSEMLINFCETTWCNIPQGSHLQLFSA
jgi:hypothetical protein